MKFLIKNNIYILSAISLLIFIISALPWLTIFAIVGHVLTGFIPRSLGEQLVELVEIWIDNIYYFIGLVILSFIWLIYFWTTNFEESNQRIVRLILYMLIASILSLVLLYFIFYTGTLPGYK